MLRIFSIKSGLTQGEKTGGNWSELWSVRYIWQVVWSLSQTLVVPCPARFDIFAGADAGRWRYNGNNGRQLHDGGKKRSNAAGKSWRWRNNRHIAFLPDFIFRFFWFGRSINTIKVGFQKIIPVFLLTLLFILIMLAAFIPGGAVAAIGAAMNVTALLPVGFILAYVGMFFVALGFYVAVPVKVAEDKGIIESLSRSWSLTAGYRWPILGLLFLFSMAMLVVILVGFLLNFIPILGQIIFLLLMLAIMPFGSFIAAAIYQRLVEIKEGKSVTSIAEVFN
jgi:hypothetical protein